MNPSSLAPGNCRHPRHCTPRKVWPGASPGGWEIPSSVRSWEGHPPSSQTPLCAEGSAVLEAVRACGCEGRAETRAQEGGCPSRLPEQAAPWPAHQRDRAVGTSDPASGGRLQQPLSLFLGSSLCCPAPLFTSHLEAVRPQGGAWRWDGSDGEHLSTHSLGHHVGSSAPSQVVERRGPALSWGLEHRRCCWGNWGSPGFSMPLDSSGLSLPVLWAKCSPPSPRLQTRLGLQTPGKEVDNRLTAPE